MDNKLQIMIHDGQMVTINVLDIIDSNVYNKSFIIYTLEGENETVFASIINEENNSYSLDTIINQDEINYINSEIDRVTSELELA